MHGAMLGSPLMMLVALPAEEPGEPGPIGGNQVTALICLLKCLMQQSLNQQHGAGASFCALVWDGAREDSGRGQVEMCTLIFIW